MTDDQRCLRDLRERFAKCAIQRSQTIVPFRETAVKAPGKVILSARKLTSDMAPPKTAGAIRGTIHGSVLSGLVTYTIRAVPLPPKVTEFLLANTAAMSKMLSQRSDTSEEADEQDSLETGEGVQQTQRELSPEQFWSELEGLFKRAGPDWAEAVDRIWSFGPKRLGANLLLDPVGKQALRCVAYSLLEPD